MKMNTNPKSAFPSQVVSDADKASMEYGYQVARAIEGEWFGTGNASGNRFMTNWSNFHNLRLYARGEQPIQKYKDELSINGDLSYLNLDWKPVPVVAKFVDIIVNGMSDKTYKINAYAQDPESIKKRTDYATNLMRDMAVKDDIERLKNVTGQDFRKTPSNIDLPETQQEVDLHMQLEYKPSIEIAVEELISHIKDKNRFNSIRKRLYYDLTVIGVAAVKTSWNQANGIRVDYCDPAKMVWSYTEDPNFEDLYYVGEVKYLHLSELKKEFPGLSDSELEEIQNMTGATEYLMSWREYDQDVVPVLYFEYKTYSNQVFKLKEGPNGLEKALEKSDDFNPPENDKFKKVSRSIEVLYSGAKVVGHEKMLDWGLAANMTRPFADTTRVQMNYSIVAPRMYKGRIESTVSRITGFCDMINITNLKLQQVLSRVIPDGVFLDVDGLAEVDLGNGTTYNPSEALNMYFQTGSILGRSLTQDGDLNRGKVPVQELTSSSGQGKISSLISTYQYYLQLIRDATGLNEARDGSAPDKNSLVGLQKMAANASNVATRHILQAGMYLTAKTCENIVLRVSDSLRYDLTRFSLESSISNYNVGTLEELSLLNIHDFGIFLELEPEEEDMARLEQNIQAALNSGSIDLEDAIDIREIRNIKMANEVLKLRRKKKQKADRLAQQQNIQMQAQANAESAEKAALADAQKQQIITAEKISIEEAKSKFEIEKMTREAEIKRYLMQEEFNYNMQLAQAQANAKMSVDMGKEDRKDKRIQMQGTQESELITQRKNNLLPKNFESAGQDTLGGFGTEQFEPR